MMRILCKSKIHRATVTEANLNYEGSLTLDPLLMEAAGLVPFEQVHVLNLNNGARFETYLIEGERGSGTVCVNGAAARLVQVGDPIIVLAYALVPEDELSDFTARIVFVDEHNRVVRVEVAKVLQEAQVNWSGGSP
jgi:aspartate 1-decarboxylase